VTGWVEINPDHVFCDSEQWLSFSGGALRNARDHKPRTEEDDSMSDDTDRSAAMRGSPGPAAWAAFADDSGETGVTSLNRKAVEEVAARMGWQVAALYREPILTDDEREAIEWALREADEWDEEDSPEIAAHAVALRGLAKRLF
jgi:hypothetical protein